jgi:molybdopterin/thiamine biosynthesis adenylyltransferase/rhodanese-related sulfurtransferase/molybdopterin converting factor small subunit
VTTIRIPAALRDYTDGATDLSVNAPSVGAALSHLAEQHPRLRRHLYTEQGELRSYVNVFLNDDEIRTLDGLQTVVTEHDTLFIVPSIAGGEELSASELQRYSRHLSLNEIGMAGQLALKRASVLVVGAGGLGSPVSLYLAAAGVGRIGIIDFDRIDATNLQRQVLYGTADIGKEKIDVAVKRLRDLNPEIDVVAYKTQITSENALEIIASYDVVIDGTDNFPTRYLVNDACVLLGKPYVYGSILRFDGQVSVFDAKRGPCYRCLFKEPPPPGLVPNCAEGGVLGALPGIIGSMQALEAIKLVTNVGETLIGRLLLFDALSMKWRELKLKKNPNCVLCGENPTITGLIDYDEFCGITRKEQMSEEPAVAEITVTELKARLDKGERPLLIDVREPFEWKIANLGDFGARMIPMRELPEHLDELPRDQEIILYCRSGARSGNVAAFLMQQGFQSPINLKGGILAWAREVDPSVQTY